MAAGKRILFMDAMGPLARNLVGRFSESGGNNLFLVGRNEQHICSTLSHVKSEVAAPNSFESAYSKAKDHLGGKPNVIIANAGCGRFSLLQPSSSSFLSPPETKRILSEDLTTFRENLDFAHESLSCLLSDVYEPVEEDQEPENPCHVVVLGSMAGYNRLSTGGAVYDSELSYFYENMRASVKDSNVNMVLLDVASDHISTTGRVVMYDTKYDPPYSDGNTEEEVGDAISKFLDIPNSDLSKIIWPNYSIAGGPMLQKLNFVDLFKKGDIEKCDEFVVEKAEPVMMAAAPTEEAEEEEEVKVEKTIFNIVLASVDDLTKNKLKVIKAIRAMKPEDSLVQCKEYVTKMPAVLLKDVPKEDADKYAQALTEAGGVVELQ